MAPERVPAIDLPAEQVLNSSGLLAEFNRAGVLTAADVHVAALLGRLGTVNDERVLLAIALAVRAPRLGHVCVDLGRIATQVSIDESEVDRSELPWPDADDWRAAVACAERLIATDEGDARDAAGVTAAAGARDTSAATSRRPLRLENDRLYLDRYWRQQRQLANGLLALAAQPPRGDDTVGPTVAELIARQSASAEQNAALAAAANNGLSVIVGGPGSGKTTTIVRLLAVLCERWQAQGAQLPAIAVCAPTGRAASRTEEAIQAELPQLDLDASCADALRTLRPRSIHRLIGSAPNRPCHHNRDNPLPHDIVVVDECSMVSLSLMSDLIDAVRPDAQLVLVGDPDQLTSVEAGAVLADIAGSPAPAKQVPAGPPAREAPHVRDVPFSSHVLRLGGSHRFGSEIAELADAIRIGDATRVFATLGDGADPNSSPISWLRTEPDTPLGESVLAPVRKHALAHLSAVRAAALAGDAAGALAALAGFRLLCARRTGPFGAGRFTALVEGWLSGEQLQNPLLFDPDLGRPLLIGANDYESQLMNGDTGVIVAGQGAVFSVGGRLRSFSPARLSTAQTLYASTIHKSQGSQFDTVVVVLPNPGSPVLTRQLLYTAVTRARRQLMLVGCEQSVRQAIERPVARASGLSDLLSRTV